MTQKFMDTGAMDKAIKSIAQRGAKLDKDIQEVAMSAINHAEKHQDPCYINRLYLALAKGARKSALTEWFLTFGRVVANADGKTKAEKPFLYDKAKVTDLLGAAAKPWYECKKEPDPDEVFDVQKAFAALLKKLDNAKQVKGMTPGQIERLRNVLGGDVAEDLQKQDAEQEAPQA